MRGRVEIVVVEKNKRGGGENGRFEVVVMEFLKYEVVTGIVAGMVARVVAGGITSEEGLAP